MDQKLKEILKGLEKARKLSARVKEKEEELLETLRRQKRRRV
jgi:hypothetical protein